MHDELPNDWHEALAGRPTDVEVAEMLDAVKGERDSGKTVYPPSGRVFAALELTPFSKVRAVIVGQDPYHQEGQAHGLAFSVPSGVRPPPSLRNILKALGSDLGIPVPIDGCLEPWARRGVLLLNRTLTVRENAAGSHSDIGWDHLTQRIVDVLAEKRGPIVFLLWGKHAQRLGHGIDNEKHIVLCSPHPSPLSARLGFFGAHPFLNANAALALRGADEIDWTL